MIYHRCNNMFGFMWPSLCPWSCFLPPGLISAAGGLLFPVAAADIGWMCACSFLCSVPCTRIFCHLGMILVLIGINLYAEACVYITEVTWKSSLIPWIIKWRYMLHWSVSVWHARCDLSHHCGKIIRSYYSYIWPQTIHVKIWGWLLGIAFRSLS